MTSIFGKVADITKKPCWVSQQGSNVLIVCSLDVLLVCYTNITIAI